MPANSSSTALVGSSAKGEDNSVLNEDKSNKEPKKQDESSVLQREPNLNTKSSTLTLDLGRIEAGEIFHRQAVPDEAKSCKKDCILNP